MSGLLGFQVVWISRPGMEAFPLPSHVSLHICVFSAWLFLESSLIEVVSAWRGLIHPPFNSGSHMMRQSDQLEASWSSDVSGYLLHSQGDSVFGTGAAADSPTVPILPPKWTQVRGFQWCLWTFGTCSWSLVEVGGRTHAEFHCHLWLQCADQRDLRVAAVLRTTG